MLKSCREFNSGTHEWKKKVHTQVQNTKLLTDNTALSHLTRDTEKQMTLLFILAIINI